MNNLPSQEIYKTELKGLYGESNSETLSRLSRILTPHATSIAKDFYQVMLDNEPAVIFLSHELIESRLSRSMAVWITELFVPQDSLSDIEELIIKQVQVGHVHARIDLPMSLVSFGIRTLKASMSAHIQQEKLNAETESKCLILMNALVDTMSSLINDSYVNDIVVNEKNAQAFRMQVSSQSLAFDFERLRTSLLDWTRRILTKLHEENIDKSTVPTIRHSDFGLWLTHKGALILTGKPELKLLIEFVSDANALVEQILDLDQHNSKNEHFNRLIDELNEHVSNVIWVLGNTAQEMLDIDSGRDSLTHLFNRRYLSTVLHHETECSIKTGMRYGVLYIDIDHFKDLNDNHGHDNGDTILQQFAMHISQTVRTGDFTFRYGGEEFLIVLADITQEQLPIIAEKVRALLDRAEFKLNDEKSIHLTASIGAALHDGHPDYQRTIANADKALYLAKENGRNKVVIHSN